jgi:hypothetical protein
LVTLAFALLGAPAFADGAIDPDADFAPGSHTRFVERVGSAQQSDYRAVLDAYDERRRSHPADVTSQIERCRFIEPFAYSEDAIIESANDDLGACRESLASGPHAKDIDVMLYGVEYAWSDEGIAAAKELLVVSRKWDYGQQATLLEHLSAKVAWKDGELAANYAMRAVELKPDTRVILTAVERYIQLGAKDKARRVMAEAPATTWDNVPRATAAQLLIDLGDPKGAAAMLNGGGEKSAYHDKLMLANVLVRTGAYAEARKLYRDSLAENQYVANDRYIEFFDFEREHGSREQAVAAYKLLRDKGYGLDPLARHRLALFVSFPGANWQLRDGLGLLSLLALGLFFLVMPILAIVPVHYRGLARRLYARVPDKPGPTWNLRHAWYALAAFMIASAMALYLFAPTLLEWMLPWTEPPPLATPIPDTALGHALIVSVVAGILLMLPILRRRPLRSLLLGKWSVTKSILVGLGIAIGLKILAAIVGLTLNSFGSVLGSDTVRSMQGVHQMYGLAALLLAVAVAVPFLEELVFRGVLLEAFRGQVTFLFAAIIQALAFVLMHESWSDMPFLFAFALIAAWLVKRSEGLLAAMSLHTVNNLLAAMAIVGYTNFLNK